MVCRGVPGQNLVTQGTGLINWSMLVIQSSCVGSHGTSLTEVLAVVDGAGSHTLPCLPLIPSCPPVSNSSHPCTLSSCGSLLNSAPSPSCSPTSLVPLFLPLLSWLMLSCSIEVGSTVSAVNSTSIWTYM